MYSKLLFILLVILISSCNMGNAPKLVSSESMDTSSNIPNRPLTLREQIEASRQEKDRILKLSPDSPILKEERTNFKGLNYFPVNLNYRLDAKFEVYKDKEQIKMLTSKGEKDVYIRYGALKFTLDGVECSLDTFKSLSTDVDPKRLFIPFRDTTSGKETYGAGRYLELDENTNGIYTVDFNLAYNPYCAYNIDFSCPLPPEQNTLKVAVRAGEKNYHE